MSKTVPEINVTGNVAVMRAALLIILDDARKVCKVDRNAVAKICKDALAVPLRNCDVGTPKEQSARFDKFCHDHLSLGNGCNKCPFLVSESCCDLAWAQAKYEEGNK